MRTQNNICSALSPSSVQTNFSQWRKTRSKRGRIPSELWSQAVALAEIHGVFYVGRLLGLNYNCLKDRMISSQALQDKQDKNESPFIELPALIDNSSKNISVDLKKTDGSQMKLQMPNATQADLFSLIQTFLG